MKILLLCQPGILLDGVKCLLSQLDCELDLVGETESGRRGLELARSMQPDVALVAFGLDDINTVDTIRELTQNPGGIRLLILGEDLRTQPLAEALQAGAIGCITPDCGVEEFRKAIEQISAGERYLCNEAEQVLIDVAIHQEDAAKDPVFALLTSREREVLQLLAEGNNAKEIGSTLNISSKTVDTHRQHIMEKLSVDNLADLVKAAIRAGISDLEA